MTPVAVISGGSGGLGRAIGSRLAGAGYEIHSWSRSDGVDASDEVSVEAAASGLGRFDVLINNAALLINCPFAELAASDWDAVLNAGLRSAFLCSRAAFRRMQPGARIVMISSLSGVAGTEKFPGMAAYVAAKSGLAGLIEVLAVEGRPLGIRVNGVSPGAIRTPMLRLSGAPPEPALEPDQVAGVVAYLASPESAPLTGANLRIDPPPPPPPAGP